MFEKFCQDLVEPTGDKVGACEADNCENKNRDKSCLYCYWNSVNNSDDSNYNLFSSGYNNEHHPRDEWGYPKYANVKSYENERLELDVM